MASRMEETADWYLDKVEPAEEAGVPIVQVNALFVPDTDQLSTVGHIYNNL